MIRKLSYLHVFFSFPLIILAACLYLTFYLFQNFVYILHIKATHKYHFFCVCFIYLFIFFFKLNIVYLEYNFPRSRRSGARTTTLKRFVMFDVFFFFFFLLLLFKYHFFKEKQPNHFHLRID